MDVINGFLNFMKWLIIATVVICLLYVIGSVVSIMEFTPSKRVASRTSGKLTRQIKKSTTPFYGQKGTGIYKNPSRTVKNKVYRSRSKKLF